LAEGVVERAEATDDREAFLRKKVENGKLPMHHIYPPNQEVLREYEEYKKRGGNV
jgi:antitoxin component of RelBE/YafQ-DinJ toxin-antitoxin module